MEKSLATGSETYVKLQGSIREDGLLHIQGRGPEVNRPYGVATDQDLDTDLCLGTEVTKWLKNLPTDLHSLVSDRKYFPILGRDKTNYFHIQIPGPALNRDYGAAFDLYSAEIVGPLRKFYELSKE